MLKLGIGKSNGIARPVGWRILRKNRSRTTATAGRLSFETPCLSGFLECFQALPESVQEIARNNFALLKENPGHPSLHFKRVGNFVSVRVGIAHRALGTNL